MKVSDLPYKRVTIEYLTREVNDILHTIHNAIDVEQVLEARKR